MYNLYQSTLWKQLGEEVYHRPSFDITICGRPYRGTVKTMRVGPFSLRWLQVLGVDLPDDMEYVRQEVQRIQSEYAKQRGTIFMQRGIINQIVQFENISHRSKGFKQEMREMRLSIRRRITQSTGMRLSVRENMPQANIVYMINKSDEKLLSEMNSGCKARVKKSIKKGAHFRVADPSEYEQFYQAWVRLAGKKGFNVLPYPLYTRLIEYITKNTCGNIFVAELDGQLLAGSICVYDEHRIIYLYGFASRARKFRNLGAHHFLKFKIFGWAREQGLTYCDMMGGAPTGFDEHPRSGVSKFKESLGGVKIEQYGSYDIVIQPWLYKLFVWRQQRRDYKKAQAYKKRKRKRKNREKKKSKIKKQNKK